MMLISLAKSPDQSDFAAHYFVVTRSALFIPSRGDSLMSQHSSELVARLRTSLVQQRYSAMVIHNYCVNAAASRVHIGSPFRAPAFTRCSNWRCRNGRQRRHRRRR